MRQSAAAEGSVANEFESTRGMRALRMDASMKGASSTVGGGRSARSSAWRREDLLKHRPALRSGPQDAAGARGEPWLREGGAPRRRQAPRR